MDDFEHQLTVQVKDVLSKCREVTETRGQPIFVDKAKEAVAKTRDFGNFLQRAQREELLPHAKKVQVSVGQLIRVANNIGASNTEVADSYQTVVADIKAFCQAAKTEGSNSPITPRTLGNSPLRTDSPLSARGKAPPLMGNTRGIAQSTPDLFSSTPRDSPSPRALGQSMQAPKKPAPPPPIDDEYAPAEDDDEEMIQLKKKLSELKRQKEEVESEPALTGAFGSSSMGRLPSMPSPTPASAEDGDVETDEIRKELDPDICFTCGRRPQEGPSLLNAVDRKWHKTCWQCYECKKPLVIGAPFGSDGPRVYCEEDYKRKFFCAHCGDFIEDEAEEQGRKLYHLDCFVKFLDEKNKKDSEKMEAKKKQMQEDDEAYRKWIDEFEKITKRPSSVSPPPAQMPKQAASTSVSASTRAPATASAVPPEARQASHSTSDLDPARFPKYQQGTPGSSGALLGPSAADLLAQLGKPPSARDDPAGYKAYMRKRFALEEQLNKEQLAKQRIGKK